MHMRRLQQYVLTKNRNSLSIMSLPSRQECSEATTTTKIKPFILIGCGNPLLDISARVDHAFLEKYNLKPNRAYLAELKHEPLYEELIKNYHVEYIAGGAVQNSLRVCQWILQQPFSTVFFGSVGKDDYAKILQKRAHKDGVSTQYQQKGSKPTGTCAVLITDTDRTLVANLAAAESFTVDHLKHPLRTAFITNAEYFYVSGFFLTVCLACILDLAKTIAKRNNCLIFNMSATYIPHRFMVPLMAVLPYVDILVGNEYEMLAFAKASNWNTTDRGKIGKKLQDLPKHNQQRSRIVMITQGPGNVLVFQRESIDEYDVPKMPDHEIVDTNGAGDAFVGGFLAQYLQDKSLDVCIKCGIYAAQHILLQSGCKFRGKPNFKE